MPLDRRCEDVALDAQFSICGINQVQAALWIARPFRQFSQREARLSRADSCVNDVDSALEKGAWIRYQIRNVFSSDHFSFLLFVFIYNDQAVQSVAVTARNKSELNRQPCILVKSLGKQPEILCC